MVYIVDGRWSKGHRLDLESSCVELSCDQVGRQALHAVPAGFTDLRGRGWAAFVEMRDCRF